MRITDNSNHLKTTFAEKYPNLSNLILDKTLSSLLKEENILVFPSGLSVSDDLGDSSIIVETLKNDVKFGNIIGFIGAGNEQLEIHSRFSKDNNDYFLHYMLQKVLNVNIVDLDTKLLLEDQFYLFLCYMFPRYLNTAVRKGVFKEYRLFNYNDENIKGAIDFARHIKTNTPFMGKAAYSTRGFTQNNELMQLIRHTIEYIRSSFKNGSIILDSSAVTKENVSAVIKATPYYNRGDKQKLLLTNITNPVRHAYYYEYRELQKLCLMILSHRRHSLGGTNKNICGILFDVAWLWEKYINTLLKPYFMHSRNKKGKDGISLFVERTRTIYPDFYTGKHGMVLDAKYKRLELAAKGIRREDLYQIITYSYILQAKKSGVVYPSIEDTKYDVIGVLAGYGAEIFKQSIHIPQEAPTYSEFAREIEDSEMKFQQAIKSSLDKTIISQNILHF